jgi:hypothetical protein
MHAGWETVANEFRFLGVERAVEPPVQHLKNALIKKWRTYG